MPGACLKNTASFPNQKADPEGEAANNPTRELAMLLQTHRQTFDMSLEEALEGLQEAQQVLNTLRAVCFSEPVYAPAPAVKRKVQRASSQCARLITEVIQRLQPFSQELQALLASTAHQESSLKEEGSHEEG